MIVEDTLRNTPLHFASDHGYIDITVNVNDHLLQTPLYNACIVGNSAIVESLLKAGANVRMGTFYSITPLHESAMNGYKGVGEILLKAGASVTAITDWGDTPLHKTKHKEITEILLKAGYRYTKHLG